MDYVNDENEDNGINLWSILSFFLFILLCWTVYLTIQEFTNPQESYEGVRVVLMSSIVLIMITAGCCIVLMKSSLMIKYSMLRSILKTISVLVVLFCSVLVGYVVFYMNDTNDTNNPTNKMLSSLGPLLTMTGLIASVCMLRFFYKPDVAFLKQFYLKKDEEKIKNMEDEPYDVYEEFVKPSLREEVAET